MYGCDSTDEIARMLSPNAISAAARNQIGLSTNNHCALSKTIFGVA